MVCLYLRVYSIIFYVVRQVVGGSFSPRGGVPLPLGCPAGAEPRRHWLDLPRGRGPSQTPKFLSPGPPSPWLPAPLIGNRFLTFLQRTAGALARGARMAETVSAANGLMQGCRGLRPRQNKLKVSPLPAGKGVGGMGAGRKTKGGVGRRPGRQVPRGAPQRQRSSRQRRGQAAPRGTRSSGKPPKQ